MANKTLLSCADLCRTHAPLIRARQKRVDAQKHCAACTVQVATDGDHNTSCGLQCILQPQRSILQTELNHAVHSSHVVKTEGLSLNFFPRQLPFMWIEHHVGDVSYIDCKPRSSLAKRSFLWLRNVDHRAHRLPCCAVYLPYLGRIVLTFVNSTTLVPKCILVEPCSFATPPPPRLLIIPTSWRSRYWHHFPSLRQGFVDSWGLEHLKVTYMICL